MNASLSSSTECSPIKISPFSADPSDYSPADANDSETGTPEPEIELERVGGFSLNYFGTKFEDDSNLRRLLTSAQFKEMGKKLLRPNLTEGMRSFLEKDNEAVISEIYKWIRFKLARQKDLLEGVDFVCRRSVLTHICTSGYECEDRFDVGLKLACVRHKGICFLNEYPTDLSTQKNSKVDPYVAKAIYAGFKFEQMISVAKKSTLAKPTKKHVLDTRRQYEAIFKAKLNAQTQKEVDDDEESGNEKQPIKIMFGAEIDCEDPETGELVEVKTNFKSNWMKDLRWWAQSYLVGIQRIIVGKRDRSFYLERIDEFKTEKLRVDESAICMAFLHAFLTHLKDLLGQFPEGTVLLAERARASKRFKFTVVSAENQNTGSQHNYGFLPADLKKVL